MVVQAASKASVGPLEQATSKVSRKHAGHLPRAEASLGGVQSARTSHSTASLGKAGLNLNQQGTAAASQSNLLMLASVETVD